MILHTHEDACYETITDETGAERKVLICTQPVLEEHIHGEGCFTTTEVAVDTENLTCTLEESEEHTHGPMCYGTWEMTCGMEAHVHNGACYPSTDSTEETNPEESVPEETDPETGLTESEQASVDYVIGLIDAMPSADEIDAKLAEFEAAEDYEGEEIWYTEVTQQVAKVYSQYNMLSEGLKAHVTNADKLLELEYIWSAVTLAEPYTAKVCWIDAYDYNYNNHSDPANFCTTMFISEPVDDFGFGWWTEIVVERKGNFLQVTSVISAVGGIDKGGHIPSDNGFILLVFGSDRVPNVQVDDYVSLNGRTLQELDACSGYSSSGYCNITFSQTAPIVSAAPTVDNYTSTRDFIELNIYDYNYSINEYWDTNQGGDEKFPGFQWNGGAYSKSGTSYRTSDANADKGVPNYYINRHRIDGIDFGNSMITNFSYGSGSSGDYSKAAGAFDVGNQGGLINTLDVDDTYGVTNRSTGFSVGIEAMNRKLIDGYPALADGTSLAYLFNPAKDTHNAVTKLNTQSIDGLFLQDPVSGMYSYNSRENHAQYANNFFTRYKQIITPNFITYPFGNFLPLNTITNPEQATQVGAFNKAGGMAQYVDSIKAQLRSENDLLGSGAYKYTTRQQLITMLEEYEESWAYDVYNSTPWSGISPANAIRDYFQMPGDNPSDDVGFLSQAHLDKMYNIDWDVDTNFFFGMEMKMNFYQPKNGMTGNDTNGDGEPDYPMEFYFTGDDDVWVYIDGVLFLDLSGIHRHVGGKIDFVNGIVSYYPLTPATGDVSNTEYKWYSFAQLFRDAGWSPEQIDEVLKPIENNNRPFKDYTNHTFNFYYMERGSGSSVCRLNFNFPLLRKNSITVTKQNVPDQKVTVLGNPDYYFSIIPETNAQKPMVGPNSVTGISTYTILDSAGNKVGTDTVDEYGIFTLKAGQSAVFEGIPENVGVFHVQELIREADDAQYGKQISINGAGHRNGELIKWNQRPWYTGNTGEDGTLGPYNTRWYAYSSQKTDASSNSTFYFETQNGVATANLGKLSISKVLENMTTDRTFDMEVTLDGEKLPVGTRYTVGTQEKTVETEGIITIGHDETATIPNIISGTRFTIREINDNGAFDVGYSVTDAEEANTDGAASGIVRVNTEVAVTVTNTPDLDISVVKELTNTSDVDMVGDPYFSFQIMKGNADGSHSQDALYGAGVSYNVYDAATGELLRENQKTGQHGIFKIKAGERAELNNVQIDTGKYYIREVLDETFISQYDSYYVDGVQKTAAAIQGHETFWGVSSDVKDLYDGDTIFTFENKVNTEKLSYLTITKWVNGEGDGIGFDMEVLLNGEPIPVGTPYQLYDTGPFMEDGSKVPVGEVRYVSTPGIVTVLGGTTAEIDYIIPGTTFRVSETSGSAEGYKVEYNEYWGTDWIEVDSENGYVAGTVPVNTGNTTDKEAGSHVCVVVKNTQVGNTVLIPVTKTLSNGSLDPDTPHTYSFTIELVKINGKPPIEYNASYTDTKEVTVTGNNPANFNFAITYLSKDFTGPSTLIYKITENAPDTLESTHDTKEYYATVKVNFSGNKITGVNLESIKKGSETGEQVTSAAFDNTLLGDLTLEKHVDGGTVTQENSSFNFTVQIGTNGTTALQNWTVQVVKNGVDQDPMTTDANGKLELTGIKHGDRVQLRGIPLGCVWRITEANVDGYMVSWAANEASGSSNVATGDIPAGGMEVVYTNTQTYVLPETGGMGTTMFYVFGAILMLGAAVLLVTKRRMNIAE